MKTLRIVSHKDIENREISALLEDLKHTDFSYFIRTRISPITRIFVRDGVLTVIA